MDLKREYIEHLRKACPVSAPSLFFRFLKTLEMRSRARAQMCPFVLRVVIKITFLTLFSQVVSELSGKSVEDVIAQGESLSRCFKLPSINVFYIKGCLLRALYYFFCPYEGAAASRRETPNTFKSHPCVNALCFFNLRFPFLCQVTVNWPACQLVARLRWRRPVLPLLEEPQLLQVSGSPAHLTFYTLRRQDKMLQQSWGV